MGKQIKPRITLPEIDIKTIPDVVLAINQPADIIITNTDLKLQGSKIKFFGSAQNVLATFDSKTSTFTVHKKLLVGSLDISAKLQDLEARVKNLES